MPTTDSKCMTAHPDGPSACASLPPNPLPPLLSLVCTNTLSLPVASAQVWPLHYEIHPEVWAAVRAAQLADATPGASAASSAASVASAAAAAPAPAAGSAGVLARVVGLTVAAMVVDELAYHLLFLFLSGADRVPTGCTPKLPLVDADCIVCHGAGLDDAWLGPLETFCGSGRHGAHRRCMLAWVQSRQRYAGLCPACRSPITFQYQPWWRVLHAASALDVVRRIEWLSVVSRACVTALFVALVSTVVQLTSLRVRREVEAYHRQLFASVS